VETGGPAMTIEEVEFDYTLSCDGGRRFCLPEESAIDVNVGTTIRGFPNCGSWLIPLETIQPVTREREPTLFSRLAHHRMLLNAP
jgi:hypothetical protein